MQYNEYIDNNNFITGLGENYISNEEEKMEHKISQDFLIDGISLKPLPQELYGYKYKEEYIFESDYYHFTNKNVINIGSAGGMTRLSTGYTFLNIQEHSKYLCNNINNIKDEKIFNLGKKYNFLDKIFLKVIKNHPEKMPEIFYKMFNNSSNKIIKFLSNKSNFFDDLSIILKMPKIIFLKALFK